MKTLTLNDLAHDTGLFYCVLSASFTSFEIGAISLGMNSIYLLLLEMTR